VEDPKNTKIDEKGENGRRSGGSRMWDFPLRAVANCSLCSAI